jgi:ubiquinone/menaquinone biosynthesis C-methylase UbiE
MTDWRSEFEKTYRAPPSRVDERIWREVFGDEYPEGVDPYSLLSASELRRFAADLGLHAGETLLDVGCGRGGAGLWVALATGTRLIGIDIAEAALVAARERALALGVDATFLRGEFEATGLPDGSVDALMSVDALLFTPDKAVALRELRRVLRTGGRLCLTSWDYHTQPAGRPPQVADHRPLAEAAAFRVLVYEETEAWRERQRRAGRLLLEAAAELAEEAGTTLEDMRAGIEEMNATTAMMIRRFFMVAVAR